MHPRRRSLTNHGPVVGHDDFLGARGQLDTRLARFGVVSDDGGVVARGAGQGATVSVLLLHVANDGTCNRGDSENPDHM